MNDCDISKLCMYWELEDSSRIVYVVCSHDNLVGPTNVGIEFLKSGKYKR